MARAPREDGRQLPAANDRTAAVMDAETEAYEKHAWITWDAWERRVSPAGA